MQASTATGRRPREVPTGYYTVFFVLAGIMRCCRSFFCFKAASKHHQILTIKDRFIQITIILWIALIYLIIYMKKCNNLFFK